MKKLVVNMEFNDFCFTGFLTLDINQQGPRNNFYLGEGFQQITLIKVFIISFPNFNGDKPLRQPPP